jgi:hypothetical protein
MITTVKEARGINSTLGSSIWAKGKATGFLQCLTYGEEVKALVEALEYYCNHKVNGYIPSDHNQDLCELNFREKALAAYKAAVKEEADEKEKAG